MPARSLVPIVALLAAVGGLAFVAYSRWEGAAVQPIPGMVRRIEIRVAPEVSGRLQSITVAPGQHVKAGDLLAVIDNPDLTAALGEARAAAVSAVADRANVYSGVRAEQISIANEAVRTAEANLLLAQQQNYRAVTLNTASFLSRQQLDESTASLAKAKADLDGMRALLASDQVGATAEERRLSDARAELAQAAVTTLEAELTKTRLTAPADGSVGTRVGEQGEIVAPGKAVMTLDREDRPWFAFTLREDALRGLALGDRVPLLLPDGRSIEARVTELRPLGEFAIWRAARAVGDHDLNSFRLRLDPVNAVSALEPGTTVWLSPR